MSMRIRHIMTASLVLAVAIMLAGCGRQEEPQPEGQDQPTAHAAEPVSPAPEAALEARINEQWRARVKGLDLQSTNGINRSHDAMRNIISALSAEDFELLRSRLLKLSPSEMTAFQNELLGFAVLRLARNGEREQLVSFLAARCPRAIPPAPIEFTLAAEERRKKLPDGFTVLVEAWRAAKNDEARATLMQALASAMPSLRAQTADDTQFVTAVEAWHAAQKGQLPELRPQYVFAWQDHQFSRGNEELFKMP